ncbi:TetR/AcrR family transcriptional regulator [Streptomyces sp. NPDC127098]|uniref:TetR/AcrR family transcriptional regulator n=1 Tax=Streptomyces sp. NPDC127098 TaxID=3347137 RepID=UPI0036472ED2
MPGRTLRQRVRAEITEEILAVARRHLASEGANLSLRAVARDTGLVPSALYRYFDSRDALLSALITEAYEALAGAVDAAVAASPTAGQAERWLALCHAVRTWALAHPAEYALIYGSPVPGYAAPRETVGPAARILLTLAGILFASASGGGRQAVPERPLPPAMREDVRRLMGYWPTEPPELPVPPDGVLAMALTLWTQLFGLVTFECFGRLDGMIDARHEYFDHQVRVMADLAGLGLPDPAGPPRET